jgi:hypothetical protein
MPNAVLAEQRLPHVPEHYNQPTRKTYIHTYIHTYTQGKVPLEINCHRFAAADTVSGRCKCLPAFWGDGKLFCRSSVVPEWAVVDARGDTPPAVNGHALAQVCVYVRMYVCMHVYGYDVCMLYVYTHNLCLALYEGMYAFMQVCSKGFNIYVCIYGHVLIFNIDR